MPDQWHGRKPKSILSIDDISKETILHLFNMTDRLIASDPKTYNTCLQDHGVAHLFFEPSTRTLSAFHLAAGRLGAHSFVLAADHSSRQKGESIEDTLLNMAHMGYQTLIVRLEETNILTRCLATLPDHVALINAGEGHLHHPSQALGDAYTIQQKKNDWPHLNVAIVGDIQHSRVARSHLTLLRKLGVANITLIGPQDLVPKDLMKQHNAQYSDDLAAGLRDADVVLCLRLQRERLKTNVDTEHYAQFQLTPEHLKHCAPDVMLLHPGPIMAGVEIDPALYHHPSAHMLEQVRLGVWMRMAMMLHASGREGHVIG